MSADQHGAGAAQDITEVPKRPRRKAKRRASKPRRSSLDLFHWNDLPEYLRDNEYIVTGYRADTGILGSLKSLFKLHNESGNVWTHLIGFVFFIFLLVCIVRSPPTPMALRSDDVETLWLAVSHRLDNVSNTVLRQLQSLQSGVASHMHPLHALTTETDGHSRLTLKEGLSRSLHTLEHGLERMSHRAAHSLHALGTAVMEPRALADSLSRMTHSLPHNLSEGFDRIASAVTPPPAQLQDVPQHVQDAARSLLEQAQGEQHDGRGPGAAALDAWLHAVVSKSVMWPVPRWPLFVFMAGAMACLLLSATCHLLGCCNRHIAASIWRFDYAGIVANIVSSFYPSIYYVFLCMPVPRTIYLAGITTLGAATLALSTLERFQHPKWRATRAASFAVLGLMGIVPWGHVLLAYPYTESVMGAMYYDLLMGAAYLGAASFYTLRIPEKWYPGRFDFWMHSHQIFHIFVIVGCYLHYLSSIKLVQWRDASGGCALELTHSHVVEHAVRSGDGLVDVEGMLAAFQRRLGALWHRHSAASSGSGGAAIPWEAWDSDICAWDGS